MGLFSSLAGGLGVGGGSGSAAFSKIFGESSPRQTPTQFAQLPGFARGAFEDLFTRGREVSQDPSLFAPSPVTDPQQQAIGQFAQGAPSLTQGFQQALPSFMNPFEQQVIQQTIRDIQEAGQGLRSDIGQGATAAGGFGGTRQATLESELNKQILGQIGDVSARARQRGFDTAAQRALQTAQQQQQIERQGLFDILGTQDILRQQELGQRQAPLQALEFLRGITAGSGLPTGGGQPFFKKGILQRIGEGQEGLAAVGGALSAFCDDRLKDNVEFVRKQGDINIYHFSYKGSDTVFEGVMAQEVLESHPEAVIMDDKTGYLMVDHDKLGVQFKMVG